jgi:pyruvate dehydrogenase E1 component alpha subunit
LAENPLLPHHKLQELYTLMQRCRALDLKQKRAKPKTSRPIAREAVLAATSIHLLAGDLLCAEPGDRAAEQLAPSGKSGAVATGNFATPGLSPRLLLCAGAARALQGAGSEGIVLAFATAGASSTANAEWAAALEWAQSAQLPLLLACTDTAAREAAPSRSRARKSSSQKSIAEPLDWPSMSRLAKRLRLPVLPVEGEDAVAVFRVMQESALRARMGGGPAVLWATMSPTAPRLTSSARLTRAQQPLARLRSYLTAREITLP